MENHLYGAKTSIAWPSRGTGLQSSDGSAWAFSTVGAIGYVDRLCGPIRPDRCGENPDGISRQTTLAPSKRCGATGLRRATRGFSRALTQRLTTNRILGPITDGHVGGVPRSRRTPTRRPRPCSFILWSFLNGDTLGCPA